MSSPYRSNRRSIVLPTRVPMQSGIQGGLFFAVFVSVVAVGGVLISILGVAIRGQFQAARDLPTIARLLEFAIPGYFLGFPVAGVLFAAASHLKSRMLRYALTGLLCGTAIYGAMGVSVGFIDATIIDWKEIGSIAGGLGVVWALLGLIMAALDDWRERRVRAKSAAS
jgi:hypothetical protein